MNRRRLNQYLHDLMILVEFDIKRLSNKFSFYIVFQRNLSVSESSLKILKLFLIKIMNLPRLYLALIE